jgi:hypothetical protein
MVLNGSAAGPAPAQPAPAPPAQVIKGVTQNYTPSKIDAMVEAVHGLGAVTSTTLGATKALLFVDLLNVVATDTANHYHRILPGMPTDDIGVIDDVTGITTYKPDNTSVAKGSNVISAAIVHKGQALTGLVGMSIFIIGNIYVTAHARLNAHHNVVVSLYKCYSMLLRIENFLKAANLYCAKYEFQIDSLEIHEDLKNVFKLLDEVTTQDDVTAVYANLLKGQTFKLEQPISQDVIVPVPEVNNTLKLMFMSALRKTKKGFGKGATAIGKGASAASAVIHKLMTNTTEWSNKFNSVMIEINMHFTLLVSEFFMLVNLYQLKAGSEINNNFAAELMMTENNPISCIKLQIMLAPLLRARIILFSCALSTNTNLCRSSVNEEMKQIDSTNGVSWKAFTAFLKKMRRMYTTDDAKKINVDAFIEIIKTAVSDIETSVYYNELLQGHIVREIIVEIKVLLDGIDDKSHETFIKLVESLNKIYRVVLACGRLDDGHLNVGAFHSAHYTTASELLPNTKKSIAPVHALQTANFTRDIRDYMGHIITDDTIEEFMNILCQRARSAMMSDDSYNVSTFSNEPLYDIETRLYNTYDRVDNTYYRYAHTLAMTQDAYNRLYNFIMTPIGRRSIELRGRYLAGCMVLMERIGINAITVPRAIIDQICERYKEVVMASATERLITQIKGVADKEKIIDTIDYILDIKKSAKVTSAAPTASSIADFFPQSSAIQPVDPPPLSMLVRASNKFKNLFNWMPDDSRRSLIQNSQGSPGPDSPGLGGVGGVGGRKMRRRTRKMRIMRFRKSRTCRNVKNRKYTRRV